MSEIPTIERFESIHVVRDDLYPGGTKARVLAKALADHEAEEFVLPSVATGHGGLALAYAAKELGKHATIFMPWRLEKNFTPIMKEIQRLGANIELVPYPNFFHTHVVPAAERYAADRTGTELLPIGFSGMQEVEDGITETAKSLNISPKEVWSVGGSGALTRALQKAWPDAKFYVVDVVKNGHADFGKAEVFEAPKRFEQRVAKAKRPPFNSVGNYDAKAWEFIERHASEGAVFWNVAGDLEIEKVNAQTR